MEKLQLFNKLRESQKLSDLFYPEAKEWMWEYSLNLGKFTDSTGVKYDLGIYVREDGRVMSSIVYDNKYACFNSGNLEGLTNGQTYLEFYTEIGFEHYVETIKRATKLGLL